MIVLCAITEINYNCCNIIKSYCTLTNSYCTFCITKHLILGPDDNGVEFKPLITLFNSKQSHHI